MIYQAICFVLVRRVSLIELMMTIIGIRTWRPLGLRICVPFAINGYTLHNSNLSLISFRFTFGALCPSLFPQQRTCNDQRSCYRNYNEDVYSMIYEHSVRRGMYCTLCPMITFALFSQSMRN